MEWRPVLVAASGSAAFVGLALAGAFLIVNLAPSERPIAVGDKGLLMEGGSTLQPFDAPPAPSRPPLASSGPRAPIASPVVPAQQGTDLLALLREDQPPVPTSGPALAAIVPTAPQRPPRREALHPIVAMPTRALPDTRPSSPPTVPLIRPRPEPRNEGLLTPATISQFRLSLRLTPDQEPYWLPVQQALNEIGAQQAAMIRAGQDPKEAFGIGAAMRIYSVARPLLDVLREDQKARVRAQARSMGFTSVASQI